MERPGPGGAGGFAGGSSGLWLEWERAGVRSRLPLNRSLVIGRDATSDVCLPDPTVSRRHAVVSLKGGQPFVDATGSTNGVAMDRGRAEQVAVSVGQSFRIGNTEFWIVTGPAASPVAPRPAAPSAPAAANPLAQAPRPMPAQPPHAQPQIRPQIRPQPMIPSGIENAGGGHGPHDLLPFAAMGALLLVVVLAVGGVIWYTHGNGGSGGTGGSAAAGDNAANDGNPGTALTLTSPAQQPPDGFADSTTPAYDASTGFSPDAVRILTVVSMELSLEKYGSEKGSYPSTLAELFPADAPLGRDGQPMAGPPAAADGYTYSGGGSSYTLSVTMAGGQAFTVTPPGGPLAVHPPASNERPLADVIPEQNAHGTSAA
ncbi:MAG TPA: FHA domain-containing protein, partial [Candidatus Limnocylindrales bacterium]